MRSRLALTALTAGAVMMFAPAAEAVCVRCDGGGCDIDSGSCPVDQFVDIDRICDILKPVCDVIHSDGE